MEWKESIQKYLGQITNTKSLFIILLIGVALLVLSGTSGTGEKKQAQQAEQQSMAKREQYAHDLETRLAKILSSVRGVSNVSVMITLEDTGQSIYAQNEKTESKSTGEIKADVTRASDGSYVLKNDSGGGQSPLLIKSSLPAVSGVLITAQGADDAEVKNNLMSATKAVLDVKAHRVVVLSK